MFNWFKKSTSDVEIESKANEVPSQVNNSITQLAISESETLKNQGNAYLGNGKLEEAAACFRQAIARNPNFAEAYTNLGTVFQMQGNPGEAIALYRKAVTFKPNLLPAHLNLGICLMKTGQNDAAEESLRRVVELAPEHANVPQHAAALQSLGVIAAQRGDFAKAELLLRRALELQPEDAEGYNYLGNLLLQTKRLPEAEASYRQALELYPDFANVHYNLGNLLMEAKRLSEAETSYLHALKLKQDYAEAQNNMGNLLILQNRLHEAEMFYDQAIKLRPSYVDAKFNLSMLLLSLGRFSEGWTYFECRYDQNLEKPHCKLPPIPYPQWRGESLVGKSIVICPELGFGDYIHFVRYVRLLKERGASRITLVCAPPLMALLETMDVIDKVITDLTRVPIHDYWSFPLSLPLHFGTTLDTIPVGEPYLHALPSRVDRWKNRLSLNQFKVGLVWKGNAGQGNDANRSLPELSSLASLWSVPGVTFFSLQKGQGEDEARSPPEMQPIIDLGPDIRDFADTAAIIEQLDLVISVCTSVAHLAGALGKPCWVLITSVNPCWRWLQEREDSPWYPSLRLFRQIEQGNWEQPVGRIHQALLDLVHTGSRPHDSTTLPPASTFSKTIDQAQFR